MSEPQPTTVVAAKIEVFRLVRALIATHGPDEGVRVVGDAVRVRRDLLDIGRAAARAAGLERCGAVWVLRWGDGVSAAG